MTTSESISAATEAKVRTIFEGLIEGQELDEVAREQMFEALRQHILDSLDPLKPLRDRLNERYGQPDGTILIPEEAKEDRALHLALVQLSVASSNLKTIAESVGKFSCSHETRYAGGVESPGNQIYTVQKFAANALEQMEEYERRIVG